VLGLKWPVHQVSYSSPTSAKVKNDWSYNSIPSICLYGVDKDNFTCFILNFDCHCHHLTGTETSETVGEAGGVPKSVLGRLHAVHLTELEEASDETDCARGCQWTQRKQELLSV
jgi:hypothetical protein